MSLASAEASVLGPDRPATWEKGPPLSGGSAGEESACNVGDLGLIPGLGRSPGEGNGYPLQYSGLENSMDCMSMGLQRVRRLSDFHFLSVHQLLDFSPFPLTAALHLMVVVTVFFSPSSGRELHPGMGSWRKFPG